MSKWTLGHPPFRAGTRIVHATPRHSLPPFTTTRSHLRIEAFISTRPSMTESAHDLPLSSLTNSVGTYSPAISRKPPDSSTRATNTLYILASSRPSGRSGPFPQASRNASWNLVSPHGLRQGGRCKEECDPHTLVTILQPFSFVIQHLPQAS